MQHLILRARTQLLADDCVEHLPLGVAGRYVALGGGMPLRYRERPARGNAQKAIRRYGRPSSAHTDGPR